MNPLAGRILVTGGAGFIGSALVWALNRRGCTNIVLTDFLESGKAWRGQVDLDGHLAEKRRNFAPLRFAEFVEADVFRNRIADAADSFGRFSAVFHLGACSSTTETNADYLEDNNVAYSRELTSWALAQEARFIYASSAATYGDGSTGMDDRDDNLDRLHPLNLYGKSKQDFDRFAQRSGWLDRIVGLKYFNVFGPNESHKGEMRSVVDKAYHQIIDGNGRVSLFKSHRPGIADGHQQRDFLYVKDAVEITLHFAERATRVGGLYNVGSGVASTWLELVGAIFAALGRAPQIDFIDMPPGLRDKYQYYTQANLTKLQATVFDRPMTPLTEAVRDYVQGYLVPDCRLGE